MYKKLFFLIFFLVIKLDALQEKVVIVPYIGQHEQHVLEMMKKEKYYLAAKTDDQVLANFYKYANDPSKVFYILKDGQYVIGAVGYVLKNSSLGFIPFLIVDEEYRKRGYANLLLQHVVQEMKNRKIPEIFIYVRADNIGARYLYEKKFGFQEQNVLCNGQFLKLGLRLQE